MRREKPELPEFVPPGPDNPLGTHALYLGWPEYLIHGTHKPFGIGRRINFNFRGFCISKCFFWTIGAVSW
jgi:hypothetical protein